MQGYCYSSGALPLVSEVDTLLPGFLFCCCQPPRPARMKETFHHIIENDLIEVSLLQSAHRETKERCPCRIKGSLMDNLEALQHGELRREPLQLIGGQADMCDQ